MPATAADITKPLYPIPTGVERLAPRPYQPMAIVEAKPSWASDFELVAQQLRTALDNRLLAIEHVGSTSVPGLAAKDVLDVDLIVADPGADEAWYAGALEAAGFVFVLRESAWYEHRFFSRAPLPSPPLPPVNLHVFGPDCPEHVRHCLFREHLRAHTEDRERYQAVKREAMRATSEGGETMGAYTARKDAVVREILDRAFRENGLLSP
ncbi:hypothetical protein PG984_016256 [Apiospora sp. TS-2023a]